MTEARLENRANPIPNGEASSGPVAAKTTTTTSTTKLNPSAKSFVFNTAAPAWTPPSFTAAPVATPAATTPLTPSSPAFVPAAAPATVASPAPKLKAAAKPFVPSFLAKPFVPTYATAAAVAAPVVSTPEPTTPAPAKDAAADTAAKDAAAPASAEPESEDIKETTTTTTATDAVVVETATTVVTTETTVVTTETTVTTTVVTEETSTTTTTATSDAAAAAEQAAIGARIIYSIAKLLELEPESCPMPPSVVGLPVAAETTGKAANTFAQDASSTSKGSRGGRRGNGNDSSRSLHRSNSNYSDGSSRGNGRRGGRGGRGHHNAHDTAPALEDCAPLEINEATRWKPSHSKSRLDAPEDTTEASLKEAKAILNKLSIEKFEKLSNELIAVAVRNIDVLAGVIEMIILKAKMEWHFSTMYAELCTKMARTQMPAVTIDDEVVEDTHKLFRRLLLKRCEQEFREAPSRDGFELLPPDEVAEKELILKRGILGHIRFVGELYKLQMIKARIMHQCIANLFGDTEKPDEESLECLTKLLATIGQVFETTATSDGERAAIAQYYAVIKALSQNAAQLSTRVRFMLQDLLELRKNRWVARRKETKAMTIAEVHAEAKREADEKAKASAGGSARLQRSQSMNAASDRRRSNGSTGGGASDAWKARAAASSGGLSSLSVAAAPAAPTVDADGWETVASGKPKLVKSRSNSDRFPAASTVASSPGGSAAGRPPKSSVGRKDASSSFAAGRSGRRDRDRSGSASSVGGSFSALRRGASLSDLGRPPTASPLTKSTSSSSSSSDAESSKPKAPVLSAEAFEKKIKAILEEYAETKDLDEATQCVVELASDEHHVLIATTSLNIGLEKGTKERTAVATLLAGLHARNVISTDDIATPLHEVLEFAEDMEIDIPLTLQYVAEMISPSVASGAVPLARLVASVQHLASNGKAAKVVSKTLAAVDDAARVKALVAEAELDFATLLAESDRNDAAVSAYLTDAKLACLLA